MVGVYQSAWAAITKNSQTRQLKHRNVFFHGWRVEVKIKVLTDLISLIWLSSCLIDVCLLTPSSQGLSSACESLVSLPLFIMILVIGLGLLSGPNLILLPL